MLPTQRIGCNEPAQDGTDRQPIASQRHQGWVRIAQRYDDGGCTGGDLERPGSTRLFSCDKGLRT